MIGNSTTLLGTDIVPSPTYSAPMPSASVTATSCYYSTALDSHTTPIVFGIIGVILASVAIVVNIAIGLLQIRACNKRVRQDVECGNGGDAEPAPSSVASSAQPLTATNQQLRELDVLDLYV